MRYISQRIISFSVNIGGKSKRVSFTPKMDGGSLYLTKDLNEIKAIEATDMFKNGVFSRAAGQDDPVKDRKVIDPIIISLKGIKTIKTLQDAVEYLVNLGVDATSLTTPDEIVKAATEKGVSFPNMK